MDILKNDKIIEAIEELRSRVAYNYSSMSTLELSLALIAIRVDDLGLDFSVVNDGFDPYGRIDL